MPSCRREYRRHLMSLQIGEDGPTRTVETRLANDDYCSADSSVLYNSSSTTNYPIVTNNKKYILFIIFHAYSVADTKKKFMCLYDVDSSTKNNNNNNSREETCCVTSDKCSKLADYLGSPHSFHLPFAHFLDAFLAPQRLNFYHFQL